MKSGRSGVHKPGRLDLSCKANNCGDVGTKDLGVLPTHRKEAFPLVMPAQSAPDECRHMAATLLTSVNSF